MRRGTPGSRALLPPLLLLLACEQPVESVERPTDLDRQCEPKRGERACREGLLCVRLFIPRIITDGGFSEAENYTCHPACESDMDCLSGYRCYQPMPPPMRPVCVRADVVEKLQPADGGM